MKVRKREIEQGQQLRDANRELHLDARRSGGLSQHQKQFGINTKDTINVSIAHAISTTISTDRSDRVAQLKTLYEQGKLEYDHDQVARSLADYLDEEINFTTLLSN